MKILSHVPFIFEDKGFGGGFFVSDFSTSFLTSFVIESPRPRGMDPGKAKSAIEGKGFG